MELIGPLLKLHAPTPPDPNPNPIKEPPRPPIQPGDPPGERPPIGDPPPERPVRSLPEFLGIPLFLLMGVLVSGSVQAAPPPPTLTAHLVDPIAKAQKHTATVTVTVTNVKLVDPATAKEMPQPGRGHLHYQVDGGPIIATTTTKLSFHDLQTGEHHIKVMLAGNDHRPLGPETTLELTVPE